MLLGSDGEVLLGVWSTNPTMSEAPEVDAPHRDVEGREALLAPGRYEYHPVPLDANGPALLAELPQDGAHTHRAKHCVPTDELLRGPPTKNK